MAIDTTVLATDLGNMIADLPTSFTLAGVVYTGAFTDLTDSDVLEPGGFDPRNTGSLHCVLSDFTTAPTAGLTMNIGTRVLRVNNTVLSPDGIGIRLDLEAA